MCGGVGGQGHIVLWWSNSYQLERITAVIVHCDPSSAQEREPMMDRVRQGWFSQGHNLDETDRPVKVTLH